MAIAVTSFGAFGRDPRSEDLPALSKKPPVGCHLAEPKVSAFLGKDSERNPFETTDPQAIKFLSAFVRPGFPFEAIEKVDVLLFKSSEWKEVGIYQYQFRKTADLRKLALSTDEKAGLFVPAATAFKATKLWTDGSREEPCHKNLMDLLAGRPSNVGDGATETQAKEAYMKKMQEFYAPKKAAPPKK